LRGAASRGRRSCDAGHVYETDDANVVETDVCLRARLSGEPYIGSECGRRLRGDQVGGMEV